MSFSPPGIIAPIAGPRAASAGGAVDWKSILFYDTDLISRVSVSHAGAFRLRLRFRITTIMPGVGRNWRIKGLRSVSVSAPGAPAGQCKNSTPHDDLRSPG